MYSVVKNFLERLGDPDSEPIEFSSDDTRTATAVLYYRLILVDGRVRPEELDHYRTVLADSLQVSEDELLLFEKTVLDEIQKESSLFPFTAIVKKLPEETRREILENMHQISIADRELHEFEINMVARTAELLGLPDWNSTSRKDLKA